MYLKMGGKSQNKKKGGVLDSLLWEKRYRFERQGGFIFTRKGTGRDGGWKEDGVVCRLLCAIKLRRRDLRKTV